jgi:hypothetical protein
VTPRKATAVRDELNERQELKKTQEAEAASEKRRPFVEPMLTKHDRVTRIHLISDAFGGSGFGGSGGTFF